MARRSGNTRRRFIQIVGAGTVAGLAGCGGGGGGEGEGTTESGDTATSTATRTPSGEELGPVPDAYVTATSQGGSQRNPDSLASKEAVNYQSSPQNGQQCSGCRFYIPDKNGDGLGACTLVAGDIEPDGWCSSYVQQEG